MLEMILSFVLNLAMKMGVFEEVMQKFVAAPDQARDELNAVLSNVHDIFSTILTMSNKYLSLYFDKTTLPENRGHLVEIESGELTPLVEKARQHCLLTEKIYNQHLRTWFSGLLAKEHQLKMEELFQELSKTEGGLVDKLHELAQWLATEARATLNLVDEGNLDAANGRIRNARLQEDMILLRDEVVKIMNTLYQHQNDIIRQTIRQKSSTSTSS